MVCEGQLRAGMRALAADDHPGSGRPPGQIQRRRDLGDLPVLAVAAIRRERCDPRVLGDLEDRGPDRVGQLKARRVAQPVLAAEVHDLVRRARGIGAYHDLDRLDQVLGDLRERVLDDRDVIGGSVRTRVARPQTRGQRLAGLVAIGHQRMKAIAALVGPGRPFLVGVAADQRRVDVDRDALRRPRQGPDMLASPGVRVGERVEQPGRRRDPVNDPERGRVRRHRPEQRVLVTHRSEIGKAVSAVGEHHRQVADHAPGIVPGLALLQTRQTHRQRRGEPALVGDLRQQRAARMRHQPFSVRRDFYRDVAAIALHLQGDPPEPGFQDVANPRIPA